MKYGMKDFFLLFATYADVGGRESHIEASMVLSITSLRFFFRSPGVNKNFL